MKTISIDGKLYSYEVQKASNSTLGKIEIFLMENTEIEEKSTELEMVVKSERVKKGNKWVIEKREVEQPIEVINFKKGVKSTFHSEIQLHANIPNMYIRKMVINHIVNNPKPSKSKKQ